MLDFLEQWKGCRQPDDNGQCSGCGQRSFDRQVQYVSQNGQNVACRFPALRSSEGDVDFTAQGMLASPDRSGRSWVFPFFHSRQSIPQNTGEAVESHQPLDGWNTARRNSSWTRGAFGDSNIVWVNNMAVRPDCESTIQEVPNPPFQPQAPIGRPSVVCALTTDIP
jgi:hypothetical protein